MNSVIKVFGVLDLRVKRRSCPRIIIARSGGSVKFKWQLKSMGLWILLIRKQAKYIKRGNPCWKRKCILFGERRMYRLFILIMIIILVYYRNTAWYGNIKPR